MDPATFALGAGTVNIDEDGGGQDRLAIAQQVIKSAGEMYEDLTKIMMSIRTLKQLETQFPDAVHYLPDEFLDKKPNVKQLADPKLVQRASALLLTGLPD